MVEDPRPAMRESPGADGGKKRFLSSCLQRKLKSTGSKGSRTASACGSGPGVLGDAPLVEGGLVRLRRGDLACP